MLADFFQAVADWYMGHINYGTVVLLMQSKVPSYRFLRKLSYPLLRGKLRRET